MTELTCWPLDNHEYTAQALGAAYAARSRGILHASDFAASTNADNTITIAPGVGCVHVNDYWAAFPYMLQPVVLQLDDADGVMPRWDAIALTYDKNANKALLTVRTGQPSTSPQLPEIRRDDNYDEIYLYRITRPVGATAITADHVVDLRADESFCGLMRDTVDAIDTSVMQAAFNAFLDKIETELSQLHAGTATMLRADYDSDGAVAEAGGIKAYTNARLQPVQTNHSNLAADVDKLKFVILKLEDSGWSGSAPYTQTMSIPGMTEDWIPGVPSYIPITNSDGSVNVSATANALENVAYIKILVSGNGTLTAICPEDKPTCGIWLRVPGQIERR